MSRVSPPRVSHVRATLVLAALFTLGCASSQGGSEFSSNGTHADLARAQMLRAQSDGTYVWLGIDLSSDSKLPCRVIASMDKAERAWAYKVERVGADFVELSGTAGKSKGKKFLLPLNCLVLAMQ